MSFRGQLIKAGLDVDGKNVTVFDGFFKLTTDNKLYFRDTGIYIYSNADGYLTICADIGIILDGAVTFTGDFTLGNAITDSLILKGRVATSTEAGAAISIDATTYAYAEGMELRYVITDWDDVYTLTDFKGLYLRAESQEAQAASIYGAYVLGVTNAVDITNVWGALFYGYVKGSAAVTVSRVYGIQTEVSWDAGGSQDTLSTEATPILAKVTSGNVDDYTKIHGMIIRMGDMDGGSRTFGSGIWIEDDPDMAGTSSLTTGVDIELSCTTGIKLQGTYSKGIDLSSATMTQGLANVLFGIGTQAAPKSVALTDYYLPFVVNLKGTANASAAIQAAYLKVSTDGANEMASAQLVGVATRLVVDMNLDSGYSAQCHMDISGTKTSSELIAVSAYGNIKTGARTADRVCALQAMLLGEGTPGTVVGDCIVGYFVNAGNLATTDSIVELKNQAAATVVTGLTMDLDGTVTYAFDFEGTVSDGWTSGDAAVTQADEYVKIPVKVAGVTPTLYLLAAETWA